MTRRLPLDLLSSDELLRGLHELNPWWETGRVPEILRRHEDRPLTEPLRERVEALGAGGRLVLMGPRGVGKTALLYRLADVLLSGGMHAANILYLPLDHPFLRFCDAPAMLGLWRLHLHPQGPTALLLDELPRDAESRAWIDDVSGPGKDEVKILATASHGGADWDSIRLPPVSFREFVRLRRQAPPAPVPVDPLLQRGLHGWTRSDLLALADELDPLLDGYLLRGGFPMAAAGEEDPFHLQRRLRAEVFEQTLVRDIGSVIGVRYTVELERLFLLLCLRTAGILNVRRVSQELGIGSPTVVHYVKLLEETFLCDSTVNVARHLGQARRSQSKVYAADCGLRNAVLLRPRSALQDPAERRALLETVVFLHLRDYAAKRGLEVAYWRDGKGHVDLVLSGDNVLFPVQVAGERAEHAPATRALAMFADRHPGSMTGLMISADTVLSPSPGPLFDRIAPSLPVSVFLYGLDAPGS